jgi:hypothetical protein
MSSTSLVRKVRKNAHVQQAAVETLALLIKYRKDRGSDEYGAEAGPVLGRCFIRMGLPPEDTKLTPKQQLFTDVVIDEVGNLAYKMAAVLAKTRLLPTLN